jgi:cytochrome P450
MCNVGLTCWSDTTRASLIATWWFLSRHPEHADKIRAETENVDIRDANALSTLPHLNGVINEILRLVPPAMTGGGRITGPEGLVLDGTLIPPFTKVTAPKYVIKRSLSYIVIYMEVS